ncbi:MAG: hypothetical protein KBB91_00930 [Candidatus Pacebacteria bacterium]|nr:hypothetical protein [Candidatus Paceibacterota bacterium]MBP9701049.1 hypothetical protein [Candidatus Paceibacterota bacterium]
MDTQMPTSFIPKRPVSSEPVAPERHSRALGLLSILTAVIVMATGLSFGGVYLYEKQLAAQKIKSEEQINDAKKGIGSEFLTDMKRLNARITGVQTILQNHIVVSPIFDALEQTTLRTVQYKNFSYAFVTDETTRDTVVAVTLLGSAKSYSTIALQSDAFTKSALIKNPIFSNLTVDDKTSNVNFKLVFTVSPSALSYESFIVGMTPRASTAQPGVPQL